MIYVPYPKGYELKQYLQAVHSLPGLEVNKVMARQTFNTIKGQIKGADLITPNKCFVEAPEDINVYTDGSWINPMKQYLGLGGAGIWWPGRTTTHQMMQNARYWKLLPISSAEQQMCYWEQHEHGVALYTKVGGFTGSSTRTRLQLK